MSPENGVQGAWVNFFRSLTPGQHDLFTQASTASSATTPQSIRSAANSPVSTEQTLSPRPQGMPTRMEKATRVAGRRLQASHNKKRPLNAFIAFRTYYSPQLERLTQKVKSGLMQRMWSSETRKNLWTLLAKAYTELRDNHQEPVQLEKFLAHAVTQLPVIPACAYLDRMGWELATTEFGEKTLKRSTAFNVAKLNAEYPAQTNKSVLDLVNNCYKVGLLQRSSRLGRVADDTFATALHRKRATYSQPTATRDDRIFDLEQELTQVLAADEISVATSLPDFDFNNMSIDFRTDYRPSINDVTLDQQRAYERIPLASQFHPQIQPPILGFDPSMIQDDFDPFALDADIGEFLDFSA